MTTSLLNIANSGFIVSLDRLLKTEIKMTNEKFPKKSKYNFH